MACSQTTEPCSIVKFFITYTKAFLNICIKVKFTSSILRQPCAMKERTPDSHWEFQALLRRQVSRLGHEQLFHTETPRPDIERQMPLKKGCGVG